MKILVTGASGFIGSRFVAAAKADGYDVVMMDRETTRDEKRAVEMFARVKPDFFVHMGSLVAPGRDLGAFETQIEGTLHPCLNLARAVSESVKLSVFFGSCDEYGPGPTPFEENQALMPAGAYGWAKVAALHGTSLICKQRGIPFAWVRPALVYGPYQKAKSLVPLLVRGCLRGEKIPLSPGEQTRDFIFVDDLCRMVLLMLKNVEKAKGQIVNLCSEDPRTVKSVALQIRELCGRGEIEFGAQPYRPNESMSHFASKARWHKLFGDPKLISLEEGLRRTVEAERATL